MDKTQQFALLLGQHLDLQTPGPRSPAKYGRANRDLAKTNREQSLIVHALFGKRKVMTWARNENRAGSGGLVSPRSSSICLAAWKGGCARNPSADQVQLTCRRVFL